MLSCCGCVMVASGRSPLPAVLSPPTVIPQSTCAGVVVCRPTGGTGRAGCVSSSCGPLRPGAGVKLRCPRGPAAPGADNCPHGHPLWLSA